MTKMEENCNGGKALYETWKVTFTLYLFSNNEEYSFKHYSSGNSFSDMRNHRG